MALLLPVESSDTHPAQVQFPRASHCDRPLGQAANVVLQVQRGLHTQEKPTKCHSQENQNGNGPIGPAVHRLVPHLCAHAVRLARPRAFRLPRKAKGHPRLRKCCLAVYRAQKVAQFLNQKSVHTLGFDFRLAPRNGDQHSEHVQAALA